MGWANQSIPRPCRSECRKTRRGKTGRLSDARSASRAEAKKHFAERDFRSLFIAEESTGEVTRTLQGPVSRKSRKGTL